MTATFSTLAQAGYEIKADSSESVTEDAKHWDTVRRLSISVRGRIELMCNGWDLLPTVKTYYYDSVGDGIDPVRHTLKLKRPLLSATTVSVAGNALVGWDMVASNREDYQYYVAPYDRTPAYALRRVYGRARNPYVWTYRYDGADNYHENAVAVTGVWGYHRYYSNAWQATGDTLQSGINTSATSLSVADANGVGADGLTPRFSAGQLLQIGSEWLTVTSVDANANTLTVQRGSHGTTAATHDSGAAISVYEVDPALARASYLWVAYMYKRRGSFNNFEFDASGAPVVYPKDFPLEVFNIIDSVRSEYMPIGTP